MIQLYSFTEHLSSCQISVLCLVLKLTALKAPTTAWKDTLCLAVLFLYTRDGLRMRHKYGSMMNYGYTHK